MHRGQPSCSPAWPICHHVSCSFIHFPYILSFDQMTLQRSPQFPFVWDGLSFWIPYILLLGKSCPLSQSSSEQNLLPGYTTQWQLYWPRGSGQTPRIILGFSSYSPYSVHLQTLLALPGECAFSIIPITLWLVQVQKLLSVHYLTWSHNTLCGGYFHYIGYFWKTGTMIYISLYNNAITSYVNGNIVHKHLNLCIIYCPPPFHRWRKKLRVVPCHSQRHRSPWW